MATTNDASVSEVIARMCFLYGKAEEIVVSMLYEAGQKTTRMCCRSNAINAIHDELCILQNAISSDVQAVVVSKFSKLELSNATSHSQRWLYTYDKCPYLICNSTVTTSPVLVFGREEVAHAQVKDAKRSFANIVTAMVYAGNCDKEANAFLEETLRNALKTRGEAVSRLKRQLRKLQRDNRKLARVANEPMQRSFSRPSLQMQYD